MTGDRVIQSESEVSQVSFNADGTALGAICRDGKVRLWDLKTGALMQTHEGEKGSSVMFTGPRGEFGVIGADGRLSLRRLADGKVARQVEGPKPRVNGLTSTQGGLLAAAGRPYAGSSENVVRVWNAEGREQYKLPAGLGGVSTMAFSPDGKTLVAAAYDTDLRVWSAVNGELKRVIDEMLVAMFEMSFSPDGKLLAMAGVDRTIYIWDTSSWKLAKKITGQPEMISALEFSPDSKRVVTGGMNEMAFGAAVKVIIWDVASSKQVRAIDADHRVGSTVFSPDGKLVAVADGDKTVSVWATP
jgi:WD40 repeat protein